MWSDTLLLAERAYLARLLAWGAASMVAGTAVVALLAGRRSRSPLLLHFAVQATAWGALIAAFGVAGWRALGERDLTGATRLDRLLWLHVGLDIGLIAIGIVLLGVGWFLGRRQGLLGAGVGVLVQGAALLALDGRFIATLSRLTITS